MDFKALNAFVTIVQKKSFSLAAEALCMTQPTISKMIAQLEQEIGVPLFHKGYSGRKRDSVMTYWGEQIYQHAMIILNEQQRITETVMQVRALKRGKLILGLPPLGSVLLSTLIAKFHKAYPAIELSFLEVGASGIEAAILEKRIDVGILLGHLKPMLSGIPIMDSPLCLLSAYDSPWHDQQQVALIDLKEESFLLYDDSFTLNNIIIQACNYVGFEPNVVCKSSQWDFIAKMVESHVGIALLPKIYCDQLDPQKYNRSVLIQPQLNWTLSMAWNTTVVMNPATRAWLEIVEQNLQEIHF
ncbi:MULTISPECIES: LysR family transcriptional regulator [unclassified Acinetobacter]|uniref:LysR family transcriptional regulator n=1 Tax=unclassified Acinetobacter TaxID=196816 RepID=UPI0029352BC7|nr:MULTISPECIES: LysR family transcriptional regulator [unclassified Acinetobacter]WOE33257.1 LysR family transcriptional regulator [Acinetobacter sp. SAAs470]WOE36962.1 LysR family transcriptional regulator [Acinetobacter sp. SAAs474]